MEFTIPEQCTTALQSLMLSSKHHRDGDSIRFLALFSSARLAFDDSDVKLKAGGLVVTTSTLLLTGDNIQWLLPGSNEMPTTQAEQTISNLIEVVTNL